MTSYKPGTYPHDAQPDYFRIAADAPLIGGNPKSMRQLHPMQEILKLRLWTKRVERRFNVLIYEGTATFSEGFVHPCESRVLLSKA